MLGRDDAGNFAGHFDATLFGSFDEQDFFLERDVGDVDRTVVNSSK